MDDYKDLPNNRTEALRLKEEGDGEGWYFTGKPCKHGHIAPRKAPRSVCYDCQKAREKKPHTYHKTQAWKDYQKEYQAKYRRDPANQARLDEIRIRHYVKKRYNGDWDAYNNRKVRKNAKKKD